MRIGLIELAISIWMIFHWTLFWDAVRSTAEFLALLH